MKLYCCILYVAAAVAVAAATGRKTKVRRNEKDDVHVCAEGCIEYEVCFMQTGDDIFFIYPQRIYLYMDIWMDATRTRHGNSVYV